MAVRSLVATLLLASSALAKTDLAGCTYTDVVVMPSGRPAYEAYGSRIWYVPGSGELCEFLDCGGGRAPPKTNVPGCPLYSGTETYSPSYLDLHTKEVAATATASSGVSTTAEAQVTTQPSAAPATTFETSVSETASEAGSATTAAVPVQSGAASSSSVSSSSSTATASQGLTTGAPGRNGTVTGARPTSTFSTNGAAPTGVAILGSCLIAGVAAIGLL
ncbi:hypothetical protein CCMA1212_010157 [Trichoderma ghanense]|uniref:Cell wall protein n=1 Tax=Trichoderma ghanense TaxID=65468 RepID=A0ABY2GQF2_9HYPO